ncbi:tail protein X [Salinisphaera orenii]|uniref:tail protein X n=1 Tax=Salinisphaera orenii TaxID=856731 RepID=UPI000DBE9D0D
MSAIYRTQAGDMVDEICWLYYGRTRGTVERVLAANPGLADRPLILPAGVEITLPVVEAQEARPDPADRPWD